MVREIGDEGEPRGSLEEETGKCQHQEQVIGKKPRIKKQVRSMVKSCEAVHKHIRRGL